MFSGNAQYKSHLSTKKTFCTTTIGSHCFILGIAIAFIVLIAEWRVQTIQPEFNIGSAILIRYISPDNSLVFSVPLLLTNDNTGSISQACNKYWYMNQSMQRTFKSVWHIVLNNINCFYYCTTNYNIWQSFSALSFLYYFIASTSL